jgi:hypothetical protein
MRRIGAIALVLGVALAALLAVVLLHRPEPRRAALAGPVTVNWALSTTAIAFGDTVAAEIDVASRNRDVPPASVHVATSFAPLTVVSTKVDRTHAGGSSLLRTRVTMQCVTRACLPPTDGRLVRLPAAVVSYEKAGRPARTTIPWSPLRVSSRVPGGQAALIDTPPALDPHFARSPNVIRALLLAATVLLALGGAVLVASALWPPSRRAHRRWARLSPLERSLLLVEAAAGSESETERRRTLDLLALRLGEARSPELELQTRALAWGEKPPERDDLTLLAADVRSTLNGAVRR